MNPAVKEQWVQALRSGEYEQGAAFLKANGKYCCLGVLCDLAVKAGVIEEIEPTDVVGSMFGVESDWNGTILPYAVEAWAGLDRSSPYVQTVEFGAIELTVLNDGDGAEDPAVQPQTFEFIASAIEESL